MPESNIKRPSKRDIVYSEESPDFCELDLKTGSLGTQGRQCNATSVGTDSCDQLCCRRGYTQKIVKETQNCRCHFKWCCDVTCDKCQISQFININFPARGRHPWEPPASASPTTNTDRFFTFFIPLQLETTLCALGIKSKFEFFPSYRILENEVVSEIAAATSIGHAE
ncbi:Protein Wnt-2 [Eumeta japonica]|uniref:Protein Wnt n=1 Tax=Eumeta variegata TaxID=151549 RepID=A0A4C1ZUE1_EUMVA|nr:Protein Wnt-2 [Eumeta japonica]